MKNAHGSPYIKAYTSIGEITERIVDFTYKFSQKGDDTCQIRIESSDQNLPDSPLYQEGVEYTIIWGYLGESEKQKRLVVIRNVKSAFSEEGVSIDLLLTDKPSLIKTNSSPRVYNGKTVSDINNDIANRNRLISRTLDEKGNLLSARTTLPTATTLPGMRVYETIPQANRNDYEVLKQAADNDPNGPYEIFGRDNVITVQKPNFSQKPIRSYKYKGEDGHLLRFTPESKEYFAGSGHLGVSSTSVNPKTQTFENSLTTEGNNGVETKLNESISTPNYDSDDDGPGVVSELMGFAIDVLNDFGDLLNDAITPSNDPTKATKKPVPVTRFQDPSFNQSPRTIAKVDGGDKSVNPIKDESFDIYELDKYGKKALRIGFYNTESPSFVNQAGFNTAQVATTSVQVKRPLIPTYLTGQHTPSIEDDAINASAKAAAVQHKKSLEKNPAEAKVIGNVLLESGKVITIENASKKYSGNYYIQEATHRLKENEYFYVELQMARNAMGKIGTNPINTVNVNTKYQKRNNELEVNDEVGEESNESPKKTIQELDAQKALNLNKFKFKDTPKGFEYSGL